jgi:quercetin dioxygenase-like cupin family protein
VLLSTPEVRCFLIDLAPDEEMGQHRVRERTVAQVIQGRIEVTADRDVVTCPEGSLVVWEPGEDHAVRALEPTRMLLLLAPWPAPDHYQPGEGEDPHELPARASRLPDES